MFSAEEVFKSGFCVIIGRPNVGKSTLLNALIGEKVAITSSKPQTTRNRITGILTFDDAQIVFIDTPGIHKARDMFNKHLVQTALSSLGDVNVIIYLVEPTANISEADRFIIERLTRLNAPVVLGINKVDKVAKEKLLPVIEIFAASHSFEEIVPISALQHDGLDILQEAVINSLPEGPRYFPEDMITDLPERFIVAEMVREKIFRNMRQEIPFACAVLVDSFQEILERGLVEIYASIYVERESQKGIIIGKRGNMLKQIGTLARLDIEGLLGIKVYLSLRVKVEKNWTANAALMAKMGYQE